jgi:hypothetical protein
MTVQADTTLIRIGISPQRGREASENTQPAGRWEVDGWQSLNKKETPPHQICVGLMLTRRLNQLLQCGSR